MLAPLRVRHLILDRDGVLNREPPTGWITGIEQLAWEDSVLDALAELAAAGVRLSIATNQSCIGRGVVTAEAVEALHAFMRAELRARGVELVGIFVCPHVPEDECACRKPRPGLLEEAVAASGIPRRETAFVGDAARDLEAALVAGVAPVLVRTGKGRDTERELSGGRGGEVLVFQDLGEVVRWCTGPWT